ncbi:hypothetical protein CHARACLAT_022132 [Characodon lateralis]|uniref:Uncharacterized protein n=1 Tax=Characodon lateralis TaxID=208331 RepID=A0ABU7D913_9TELE|nr:hypothetical protein [Characodon lateralis]
MYSSYQNKQSYVYLLEIPEHRKPEHVITLDTVDFSSSVFPIASLYSFIVPSYLHFILVNKPFLQTHLHQFPDGEGRKHVPRTEHVKLAGNKIIGDAPPSAVIFLVIKYENNTSLRNI